MRRNRHLIAVTLLATALCADRMSVAAPTQRPAVENAGGIMERLGVSLRRAMPPLRLYQPRVVAAKPVSAPVPARQSVPAALSIHLSPFEFRLPPPLA